MSPARRALLATLALLPGAAGAEEDRALAALMRAFAALPGSRARFTEEKAIPELDLPLPSEGILAWQAPDRLEKRTTAPIQEILTVAGDRLVYERPDRGVRQEFALPEQPEIEALVTAIRGTLAGDLPALRRFYRVEFEPGPPWRLVLTPLSLRLLAAVQRIVIAGRGTQILQVDTEGGGGTTRMRVVPIPG